MKIKTKLFSFSIILLLAVNLIISGYFIFSIIDKNNRELEDFREHQTEQMENYL